MTIRFSYDDFETAYIFGINTSLGKGSLFCCDHTSSLCNLISVYMVNC